MLLFLLLGDVGHLDKEELLALELHDFHGRLEYRRSSTVSKFGVKRKRASLGEALSCPLLDEPRKPRQKAEVTLRRKPLLELPAGPPDLPRVDVGHGKARGQSVCKHAELEIGPT